MNMTSIEKTGLLDLSQLQKNNTSTINFETRYPVEEEGLKGTVYCDWQIRKSAVGLWVKAGVTAEVNYSIIKNKPENIQLDFVINEKMVFNHLNDFPTQGQYQWHYQSDDNDCYESVDEFGQLDLKDLVRQYLILELAAFEGGGQSPL